MPPEVASTEQDTRPVVLQSGYRNLSIALSMGGTRYEEGGHRKVHTMPEMVHFRNGVASVTRELWERLGFKTRDEFVASLRSRQDAQDFAVVDQQSSPGRPPAGKPPQLK